ncbi:MAG TPA: GAF and ANTAR domain-containing protein [Acidimicrobiales bacterium]|nr:GAF and ANTAR domain-containing protein [Acidimicrobiales bacterium]
MSREALLAQTFVELADSLVDDFDVVDLMCLLADRCAEMTDAAAVGLMLASPDGELRVLASSSEAMRLLEVFEAESDQGPCVDCYRSGGPIVGRDLTAADSPWPDFAPRAVAAGFLSVQAVPMRLRGRTIGAMNMYRRERGPMPDIDVVAAQALADVSTIAILQHRSALGAQALNEQLHHALSARVVIEQAKGVVAERTGLDMEQSFARLRRHARNHGLRLTDVAQDVTTKAVPVASLD